MIRIMILDDERNVIQKKEKDITVTVFCREKRRLHGNDIPECGMVSAGIE